MLNEAIEAGRGFFASHANLIFFLCNLAMAVGLVEAIVKPSTSFPLRTSLVNALCLWGLAFTSLAIGLVWGGLVTIGTASGWTYIAMYRRSRDEHKSTGDGVSAEAGLP